MQTQQALDGQTMARHIARQFDQYELGDRQQAVDAMVGIWSQIGGSPEAVDSVIQIGLQQQQTKLLTESLEIILERHPTAAHLRGKLVGVYLARNKLEKALTHLTRLREHEAANDSVVHHLYITTLHSLKRLEEERDAAIEAQQKFPHEDCFYVSEGLAQVGLSNHQAAYDAHARALEYCKENNAHLYVTCGVMKFLMTDFAQGYEHYAHRFGQHNADEIHFAIPNWKGESLDGKKLLLYQEQGIGDIVMWSTLLPKLLEQDVKVTFSVQPKLQPLYRRSFPQLDIIDYEYELLMQQQHEHDCVAPLADLMQYLLPDYSPSEHAPVFKADEERVSTLRQRYQEVAKRNGASKLVGISWHTINDRTGVFRNIPLEEWKPLLELPHVQFVSHQYGAHEKKLTSIEKEYPGKIYVDHEVNAFDDTDSLAAQIAAMDEVVTIQNATSHLGGALGVPTTLMLSAASSWRFGLKHLTNRWYRSLTIERQEEIFNWQPVIERVAKRLKEQA